uniref:Uncharacterized protein n=1 Tax=Anguilla anguilla TaxID=7936 RepID=A0A0E9VXD4_ANGAN
MNTFCPDGRESSAFSGRLYRSSPERVPLRTDI